MAYSWDLAFISEGQICWVRSSWLAAFFFQNPEYTSTLFADSPGFCWEIPLQPSGGALACEEFFLFLLVLQSSCCLWFYSFILICLGEDLSVLKLFGDLLHKFRMFKAFPSFRKFLAIISLNNLFVLFYLPSPPVTPVMHNCFS